MLSQPEEQKIYESLQLVSQRAEDWIAKEDIRGAMSELAVLRRPVDDFFDRVTVNCDDAALRENRLRLLSRIRDTMNQVADFSQIGGVSGG